MVVDVQKQELDKTGLQAELLLEEHNPGEELPVMAPHHKMVEAYCRVVGVHNLAVGVDTLKLDHHKAAEPALDPGYHILVHCDRTRGRNPEVLVRFESKERAVNSRYHGAEAEAVHSCCNLAENGEVPWMGQIHDDLA